MFNGFVVRNYEFIRLIGSGGMGEIWSARRTTLGDVVAIKILKAHKFEDLGKAFKNFEKEAQATSLINHPNVCKVYDFFEDNNNYFLVMEFLEGVDLSKALLMNKAQPDDNYKFALYVSRQVLRALNVAHNLKSASVSKILHRDVKPANIFVTIHNEIKLLDLGIAKIETDFESTRTTEIGYSKHYSSPDLWDGDVYKGERYAENHDLYSLSLVFREICQGNFPIVASNHFKSVFDRWNAEKQENRIQTASEILKEVEIECERLAVNDFIIRRVINFENKNSNDTSRPISPAKPKRALNKRIIAIGIAFCIAVIAYVGIRNNFFRPESNEVSIFVPEKDWTAHLGPVADTNIDLTVLECEQTADFKICSTPTSKDEGASGTYTFRIRMDAENNLKVIEYGIYGEDEGKELFKRVQKHLKQKNFEFDQEISGYIKKGYLVSLDKTSNDLYKVTLQYSRMYEVKQNPLAKRAKAPAEMKSSTFYFVILAKELQNFKMGLFPGLYEKIKPYSTCSKWDETQINCTLATNKEQTVFNQHDFKIHYAFHDGDPTFIQLAFSSNSMYKHLLNRIYDTKELIPGRQEESHKFWYSKSESVDVSTVDFRGMKVYSVTIRKLKPEILAEFIESGFHDFYSGK